MELGGADAYTALFSKLPRFQFALIREMDTKRHLEGMMIAILYKRHGTIVRAGIPSFLTHPQTRDEQVSCGIKSALVHRLEGSSV